MRKFGMTIFALSLVAVSCEADAKPRYLRCFPIDEATFDDFPIIVDIENREIFLNSLPRLLSAAAEDSIESLADRAARVAEEAARVAEEAARAAKEAERAANGSGEAQEKDVLLQPIPIESLTDDFVTILVPAPWFRNEDGGGTLLISLSSGRFFLSALTTGSFNKADPEGVTRVFVQGFCTSGIH